MTANYVLAFDPGKSSGIALLSYSETEPARLVRRGSPATVFRASSTGLKTTTLTPGGYSRFGCLRSL